jgi:hypothetical protein
MLGNSWVAERRAASQEELSSMELVGWLVSADVYPDTRVIHEIGWEMKDAGPNKLY